MQTDIVDGQPEPSILIGTSGYSFDDWRGTFYPSQLDKGKMLDYYVQYFRTVEINSTYYRIPPARVMESLARRVPPAFDFVVKVPQSFTHRRTDLNEDIVAFDECLRPMKERKQLSGLLAQFPFSFKFSDAALRHVGICRDAVSPTPLYVEFRHSDWVNDQTLGFLTSEQIGLVSVDEPQLRGLLPPVLLMTTPNPYLRLHGRNAGAWWGGGSDRYDYLYSPEELDVWKAQIDRVKAKSGRIYVFFNNCFRGQAVRNALDFVKRMQQ